MTAKRYEEVNKFNGELLRITCPKCGYPMRVLAKDDDNIYQCYCASCKMDRFMKDTLDVQILTVKQLKRDLNGGKVIDGEQLFDLIYNLHEENEKLKKCNRKLVKRSIALNGICNSKCQFAKKETVGHGDIRWCCVLIRDTDPTCYFNEVCKFIDEAESIPNLIDCVKLAKE